MRINAEPEILVAPSLDTVVEQSREAALVFLPLHVRGNRLVSPLGVSLEEMLSRLPLAAFVIAAEDIDLEAEPEEGKPAEIAAAVDAAADAEKLARKSEEEAAKAVEHAEVKRRELEEAVEAGVNRDKLLEIKAACHEAEKLAKKAVREADKARAEADVTAQSAKQVMKEPEQITAEPANSMTLKKKAKQHSEAKRKQRDNGS